MRTTSTVGKLQATCRSVAPMKLAPTSLAPQNTALARFFDWLNGVVALSAADAVTVDTVPPRLHRGSQAMSGLRR